MRESAEMATSERTSLDLGPAKSGYTIATSLGTDSVTPNAKIGRKNFGCVLLCGCSRVAAPLREHAVHERTNSRKDAQAKVRKGIDIYDDSGASYDVHRNAEGVYQPPAQGCARLVRYPG